MQKTYITKSKLAILKCLQQKSDEVFTASDIYESLRDEGQEINLATVYRNLEKLTEEGRLSKFKHAESDSTFFRYIAEDSHCNEHLHMQCSVCGKIIHMECHFMDEITEHLLNEHGFSLEPVGSVLYGRCENCRKIKY